MARPAKKRPVAQPDTPAAAARQAIRAAGNDHAAADAEIRRRCRVPRNALSDGAGVRPLYTCREAFGRMLGLTASQFIVLIGTAYQQGSEGVSIRGARRPHPARRHPCHHRGRPADRQGPAHQAGQHARPPQRAGAAVAEGRRCDPRGQSAAAARQRPAVCRCAARGFRRGVALPRKIRAQQRIRARGNPPLRSRASAGRRSRAQGRIEFAFRPLPRRAAVDHPLASEREGCDVGIGTLGSAICGAGLSFRHRAERFPEEQGRTCSSAGRRRSPSPTARAATASSSPNRALTFWPWISRRPRWRKHGAGQGARRHDPHRTGRSRHMALAGRGVRRGGRDLLPVLRAAAADARCSPASSGR